MWPQPMAVGLTMGGGAIDPANQQLELAMADQDAANAVPDLKQRWTAAVSSWKRNALAWVSDDEALPQLLLFRYVHEGPRAMMTDMLTMSGSTWARTQAWQELQAVDQCKCWLDFERMPGHSCRKWQVATGE